jgi:imidazolonepropionase-like amidohydrolase
MKWIKRILLATLLLLLSLVIILWMATLREQQQTAYLSIDRLPALQANSYLIRDVNLVPMTADTIISKIDVRVVEGIIQAIGPELEEQGLPVLEGAGSYLSPGLIDMHMHLWDRFELGLYLANGVTTVRSLLGMPFHLQVKEDLASGRLIGPHFLTSSPQFSGPDDGDPLKLAVQNVEEARARVIAYQAQGYDFIKTYNLLTKPLFDAVLEQAKISGIPVVAHPSFKVDYDYHFQPGIATVEHTEDIFQQPLDYSFDREKLNEVVAGYAASGQAHCPTLTVFHNLTQIYNLGPGFLEMASAAYINPFISWAAGDFERHLEIRRKDTAATRRINEQHAFHLEIIEKLHEAGVLIVCGTDAGIVNTAAGFSLHDELALYCQAGMSNYEAIQTATVNPSLVHPELINAGTIEVGKRADLVLSPSNPLEEIQVLQDPEWVMIEGRLIDREVMDDWQAKGRNRKNFLATLVRVGKYLVVEKNRY